jgi:protoheme ferro-lyase
MKKIPLLKIRQQAAVSLLLSLLFVSSVLLSCTNRQDDQNYRRYLHQDRKIEGKAGILLTALGQPEEYDYEFFDRYLMQIFHAAFPPILQPLIMGDNGTVLMDPDHLDAEEEFTPKKLIDCYGHSKNEEGVPYTELELEWVEPREEGSPGHFLWEEKNEHVDIVEKVSIKIVASYYGKMPNKKVPFEEQHFAIFDDLKVLIAKHFPGVPVRWAWSMYPETLEHAVDELIKEGAKTIVVCDFFHVYSALEEFNSLFEEVKDAVAERAKVIFTPYPSAYPSYREAYVKMAEDDILPLPKRERKLLVLTRHGFPEIPGDPYPELSTVFYINMKKEIEAALTGTNTVVIFADTDFAGEDMDPNEEKLASFEALEMGLEEGYDHIIFLLVDFAAENTDSIFAMRIETFEHMHFHYEGKVPYSDFSQPFRTELREGKSRLVVAGTPVGKYRPYITQGFFDAIATVLREEEWPQLIIEVEEKKEGMF